MADAMQLKKAQKMYKQFCAVLEQEGWNYDEHANDFKIVTGVKGKTMAVNLIVDVNADAEIVSVISYIPIESAEGRRIALSLATNVANSFIALGNFDFDVTDGYLQYRLVNSYHDCEIGDGLLTQMIYLACATVDEYNGKLLYVANNDINGMDVVNVMQKEDE